ncbi:hypothetical protein [Reichenbachiella ulvae]|uniref:PsbP protein n=1 Tax=Reichenbachiella ulvae TaxID=2980104 RepID=A0ABT3CV38_9BACT|nr:hypothetical protein [Reichenbachiella ulvae]MCV9387103.1 hypothetical protein [Reichenbachiella ulvae]
MKVHNVKNFVLVFSLLMFSQIVYAQDDWKQYTWQPFGLEFELPSSYQVTTNTPEALEAIGEGIEFAIYPYEDEQLTEQGLSGFLVKMAERDLNLSEIDELEILSVDGMAAGFISGRKDGLMYLVLGLIEKKSGDSFYAYIAFEPDQEEVVEDALAVFESFGMPN